MFLLHITYLIRANFLHRMSENGQASAEPNPVWDGTTQDTLDWLWPGHVYLFATLFIILCLVTLVAHKRNSQRSKYYVKTIMLSAINVLSISRAVMLLVDPYLSSGSTSLLWIFFCVLITGFGTASMTASLAILLYVTVMSTRITSKYRQLNLGYVVCGITIANFVFFVTSDVVTLSLKEQGRIMLTVCQITFACWGMLVSTGFAIVAYKLRKNARATFEQAKFDIRMRIERAKLRKLGILLETLSITSVMLFMLRIGEVISTLSSEKYLEAWPWWTMNTVLRSLEIMNAIVLLLVFRRESQRGEAKKNTVGDRVLSSSTAPEINRTT